SHYYGDSGQLEKGITALELYKQTYPRDFLPYNNLASIYNQLGQFEYALDNARQAVETDPDSVNGYTNLAEAYAGLNRLDEAKAKQANFRESAAAGRAQQAVWEAVFGFRSQALAAANQAIKDFQSEKVAPNVAVVLALQGEEDRALKIVNDLAAQRPYDTIV